MTNEYPRIDTKLKFAKVLVKMFQTGRLCGCCPAIPDLYTDTDTTKRRRKLEAEEICAFCATEIVERSKHRKTDSQCPCAALGKDEASVMALEVIAELGLEI